MCFSTSVKQPEPAPAPPAPEPVPEAITPSTPESSERKNVNTKRKGVGAYRTDLNIPSGTAGGGLNVPM